MPKRSVDSWLTQLARSPFPGGRVVFLAVLFGLLLLAAGGFLAWRSYEDRSIRANERVLEAAAEAARASSQFFDDRIAVLEAFSKVPTLVNREPAVMRPVLEVLAAEDLGFGGGLGWVDADRMLQVATSILADELPMDVADRNFVRAVFATRQPYVSSALQDERTGMHQIVIAVPTFAADERLSGVLYASVILDDMLGEVPSLAPPRMQLRVVDRSGELTLENGRSTTREPPSNISVLDPDGPTSFVGQGLRGDPDRIIGVARAEVAAWVFVAEQSQAAAVSGVRDRFFGELAVLIAFAMLTIGAALMAAQRLDASHREMIRGARDLGALELLTERLASAPNPRGVAAGALEVFAQVFGTSAVAIGLVEAERDSMLVHIPDGPSGVFEFSIPLDSQAALTAALSGDETIAFDPAFAAERYPESADSLDAAGAGGVMTARFVGRNASGAVGLVFGGEYPPSEADLELFEAMVPLLGDSFGRALAAEGERRASRIFQEALLPRDMLGVDIPLQRSVRYQAAVGDAEVSGDWYDLWMIDSTRVGLVVGDVVGRGVKAAATMGQLRSALRAVVGASTSPADALGHVDAMARQIVGSPGATVVLVVLDLASGAVRLASAGHLPPLLANDDGVRLLSEMSGAPIGFFAEGSDRQGMTVKMRPGDTLVLYSDGLVERRHESIDVGIDRMAGVLSEHVTLPVEALADQLLELLSGPDNPDDIALACVRLVPDPARHFTGTAAVADIGSLRQSLEQWLAARGDVPAPATEVLTRFDEVAAAVSEVAGVGSPGEFMVEVDPQEDQLVVTVEYRCHPLLAPPDDARRVLRLWGAGEMTTRGPRIRFTVAYSVRSRR